MRGWIRDIIQEHEPDVDIVKAGHGYERHPRGLVGKTFVVQDPSTWSLGRCDIPGGLQSGDRVECLSHSGDHFQLYRRLSDGVEFGSYGCGDSVTL